MSFGSIASGTGAGAELGSFFGPWGTGIGALAGGLFGAFSKKKGSGGGVDPFQFLPPELLNSGQEGDILSRLMSFNDTPGQPLGQLSRQTLMDRMSPDFIPQFFRDDVLNPFLNAQFRLGREQVGRDITQAQDQFQRLGAYFTPDLPKFTQQINERQNLNEQDFLGNLGFRGGELAESLRTDAVSRALGLEQVTQGGLEQLLALNNQRYSLRNGFLSGTDALSVPEAGVDPMSFIAGGGLDSFLGDIFNRSTQKSIAVPYGQDSFLSNQDLSSSNWINNWLFQNFKSGMVP